MDDQVKVCADCIHYQASEFGADYDKCINPKFALMVTDLVRGGESKKPRYCSALRSTTMDCGETAVGFEAKAVQS